MSFYTVIGTELKDQDYIIAALEELDERGEITSFKIIEKTGKIRIDRSGDIITLSVSEKGNVQVEGDSRVVEAFTKRLKQFYAYASIKANLPLDFEIASENESSGDITLLLKG